MRTVSADWARTIPQNHRIVTEVTSWRGGVQLGGILRPEAGEITFDSTARIDRRITLVFPATAETIPTNPDHPLAAYGQRLLVSTGVQHPQSGVVELLSMGYYLITDWEWSDGVVTVQGESLRRLLDDSKLWSPVTAAQVGPLTYAQQVPALAVLTIAVGQTLPVQIDPALSTSLAVLPDRLYSVERTAELDQLALEWGASWRTTDAGALRFAPVPPALTAGTPAVVTVTDGVAGTLISRAAAASRSRVANVLWVTGRTPSSGTAPRGAALWQPAVGDGLLWSGPYGQAVVHETNEGLTTVAECRTYAAVRLPQLVRPGVEIPFVTLPDPSWQLDDVIELRTGTTVIKGRVGALRIPLTVNDGAMNVTLLAGDYGTVIPQ